MDLKPAQLSQLKRILRNLLTESIGYDDKSNAIDILIALNEGKPRNTGNQFVDSLDSAQYFNIQQEISVFNRKIQAIKLLREYTGLGLKEAKDIVENPAYFSQK